MGEEIQQLLEKIQRDGVDKANAEAAKIRAEAQAEADTLRKQAEDRAAAVRAKAEAEAEAFAERARVTIRQAARDTILELKEAISKHLTQLLAQNVRTALTDTQAVAALVRKVIETAVTGTADVAAAHDLAEVLRAQFAREAAGTVTVVTDDTLGTGFSIRLDGGRVEHDFTESALAAALAKHLRPDLAELVNGG